MTMMKMEGDPDQPSAHPRGRGDAVRSLLNTADTTPVHESSRQIHHPHPQETPLPSHPHPRPPFPADHLPPTPFASRPPPPTSSHQPSYTAPPPQFSPRQHSDQRAYSVHSPQQSHSGHGTPVGPHQGPYPPPDGKPPPPPPPPPPHPHNYGPHRSLPEFHGRSLAPIQVPSERPPDTMDHGAPHQHYGAPEHHHVNGNGHHHPPHYHIENHQSYGAPPPHVPQPQSYAPSPVSTHHGYASYSQNNARKKQVRAQQACNQCRQRKQKCDEERPCNYCRDNGLVCEYKDVPPPKTDRTMQQILDKLTAIESSVNRRMDKLESHLHLKPETNGASVSPTATQQTGARSGSRDVSMASADEPTMPDSPQPRDGPAVNEESPGDIGFLNVTRLDDHKTAAHHLLRDWGAIEKYFNGVVNVEDNYPMTLEEKRGSLRLYGRGEGLSYSDRVQQQQIGSPAQSEPDSFIASPSEISSSTSDDYLNNNALGPLQQIRYDASHVNRLVNSYIDNMHTFHPFLDKGRLLKQVEDFVKKMDPTGEAPTNGTMSPSAIPGHLTSDRPTKKRRIADGDVPANDTNVRADHAKGPEKPESTITNAIILLVLALGAICLEDGRVNGPIKGRMRTEPFKRFVGMPSPIDDVHSPHLGSPQPPTIHSGETSEAKKNQDVIPGLRYFTIASDILGNMHSGNEVYHAQAFLLASLYINQLGRVLESYSWINSAARVIKINVKSNKDYLGPLESNGQLTRYPPNMKGNEPAQKRYIAKLDLIKATFWSCVQLESDILAEMSLPPSHITDYESIVAYPAGVHDDLVIWNFGPDDGYKIFYTAQIWLRKTLNAVHTHVYGANRKAPQFQTGVYKPAYTDTNLILVNLSGLYAWRHSSLVHAKAMGLCWDDDDPPASELNISRLRAKYYGAEYVMTRPYLHYAVHCPQSDRDMLRKAWKYVQSVENEIDKIEKFDWINNVQNLPNTQSCDRSAIYPGAITTILLCRVCIKAAINSTTAFDGMKIRLKVTNVFGTLHAQFGNCLVLAAVCESWLKEFDGLINQPRVPELIKNTMQKCADSKHLSPALGYDAAILKHALSSVEPIAGGSRRIATPNAINAPSRRQSGYSTSANSSFS